MRLTTSSPSCADCHEIWEPKPPGTVWATPGLLLDTLSLLFYICIFLLNFNPLCLSDLNKHQLFIGFFWLLVAVHLLIHRLKVFSFCVGCQGRSCCIIINYKVKYCLLLWRHLTSDILSAVLSFYPSFYLDSYFHFYTLRAILQKVSFYAQCFAVSGMS